MTGGLVTTVVGVAAYVGLLAAGYAYNLTLVQLGLTGLGRERVGMDDVAVAAALGAMAVLVCGVALAAGWTMRGRRFRSKLRVAALAVAAQTILTAALPLADSPLAFVAWLALAALVLGIAVPATFGLASDLVPVRWRGLAAAAITTLAYGASIAFLAEWDAISLAARFLPAMALGAAGLLAISFAPGPHRRAVGLLESQAEDPRFARPRFGGPARRRLLIAAAALFTIFFVDSLGFVRLTETAYIGAAWQSSDALDRGLLVAAHAAGAIAAGVLYTSFDERLLLPWIFGIFALVALMYTFDVRAGGASMVLAMPLLYAIGVSLYTVLTFALWPDLSTPGTVTWHVAIGVALSGWFATFLSTALAVAWRAAGIALERQLSIVAAVALVAVTAIGLRWALRPALDPA